MKIRTMIVGLAALLLCGAAPDTTNPLNLTVPDPTSALRLAWYKTIPDETVLDKIKSLEQVARAANPDAPRWRIYLTPRAASIQVKGWKADLTRPDTPVHDLSLGECLRWLCRHVPDLQFDVLNERILIDTKVNDPEHSNTSDGIRQPADGSPKPSR